MAGKDFFKLPKEKVFVKFIKRQKGNITNERHVAYGGLLEDSAITLAPKQLDNGNFANVLSNEEKIGLEDLMDMESNSLSIYKKVDNYWRNIQIRLNKEGVEFDLSKPEDFIKVRILESYTNLVASNLKEYNTKNKATYKFVIVREDEESKIFNATVNIKKEAYKWLGKIEDSKKAMEDFLLLCGMKVSENSSLDWIKSEVGKKVEQEPKKFLSILNDPNYHIKLLLNKSVTAGVVKVSGGRYQTMDGINLSHANEEPTLTNAIIYLNSSDGQEMRINLDHATKESIKV